MNNKKMTDNGLEIIYQRYYENNLTAKVELEKKRLDDEIARHIINLREKFKLSQLQLAELINTNESIIQSLEDADYEGNALEMLTKIATVLKMKVQIELIAI